MAELVEGPNGCLEGYGDSGEPVGKTTAIFNEAIRLLGDLPEDYVVVVTGPHTRWIDELRHSFKASGLVGVVVMTLPQIFGGGLRGYRGVLLVDDMDDLPAKALDQLFLESQIMGHFPILETGA